MKGESKISGGLNFGPKRPVIPKLSIQYQGPPICCISGFIPGYTYPYYI